MNRLLNKYGAGLEPTSFNLDCGLFYLVKLTIYNNERLSAIRAVAVLEVLTLKNNHLLTLADK